MLEGPFQDHLYDPRGRGPVPAGAVVGSAGGAACGDLIRVAVRATEGRVAAVTFDAEGCGALVAAGSACVALVEDVPLLEAAKVGAERIAAQLGGLSAGKRHAADLAADALHRALAAIWSSELQALVAPHARRVLVGLSGGVDSAVAALLERRAGQEVVAVTLKLWADRQTDGARSCCSPEAVVSARSLAHSMGLAHLTLDLEGRFRETVVDDFIAEHDRGRTPNPCVRCNGMVRFDAMLALADRVGAGVLATGHYARIAHTDEGALLARAVDHDKDQTYMLAALRPELLQRLSFPLGELTKPQARELAREEGLHVADKVESQDLCFLAGTNRDAFLVRRGSRDVPGDLVDGAGRRIGRHAGHRRFTVGQRRGIGVAGPEPLFVVSKDARDNRVVVGPRAALATRHVCVSPAVLYRDGSLVDRVKLRYRSPAVACAVQEEARVGRHAALTLQLEEDAFGIAPGQTACLMRGELVLGYGTIAEPRSRPAASDAARAEGAGFALGRAS